MVRPLRANPEEWTGRQAQQAKPNECGQQRISPARRWGIYLVPYLIIRCGRQKTIEMNQDFHISASVLPRRAGDGETLMPAASMAAILDSAPPLPPALMGPAWPMRRPDGAVRPAIKPTIGFFRPRLASSLRNCA